MYLNFFGKTRGGPVGILYTILDLVFLGEAQWKNTLYINQWMTGQWLMACTPLGWEASGWWLVLLLGWEATEWLVVLRSGFDATGWLLFFGCPPSSSCPPLFEEELFSFFSLLTCTLHLEEGTTKLFFGCPPRLACPWLLLVILFWLSFPVQESAKCSPEF